MFAASFCLIVFGVLLMKLAGDRRGGMNGADYIGAASALIGGCVFVVAIASLLWRYLP